MNVLDALAMYVYVALIATIGIAIYGIVARPNMLKKIICLTILGDTVNVLLVLIGYRYIEKPKPPVIAPPIPSAESIRYIVEHGVDPLPQALVITAIVINLAVTAFLVALSIRIYREFGTVELDRIEFLKRGRA